MARTAVTITTLTKNTSVANPTGTALDATNHHAITPTGPVSRMAIRITNTTSSTKAATIKAGDNPPSGSAGQGDISVSLADGSTTPTVAWVYVEAARFMQDDGTINVDVASGMTGYISVIKLPH